MRRISAIVRSDLWSPYAAGVLLGVVVVLSMWIADHPVGSSGAFQNIAAYLGLELTSVEQRVEPEAEPLTAPAAEAAANADAAFWGGQAEPAQSAAADDAAFWGGETVAAAAVEQPLAEAQPVTMRVAREGLEKQYAFFAFTSPKGISWMVWLMGGIFLGALVSSVLSGGFRLSLMPHTDQWQKVFGPQVWKRWALVFGGSVLIAIAAGIAGGCTSGLAIAQGVQLSPAAFLFMMGMFITGPITAALVYRRRY